MVTTLPGLDRVAYGRPEREVLVRLLHLREVETRDQPDGFDRLVTRTFENRPDAAQLGHRRHLVEPADPHVDRMHRASADQVHQIVAGLLQPQPALDHRRVVRGHLDRPVVAEEIRGVQQEDVQRMAFDPLPAVQQPPHQPDRLGNRDAAGILDRPARAHLVGDRADPADPRRDVRRFGPRPAAQERLVEPGRLVDPQLDLGRLAAGVLDVHGALALHPGERADVHHLPAVGQLVAHDVTGPSSEAVGGQTVSCRSDSRRNGSDAALKVR